MPRGQVALVCALVVAGCGSCGGASASLRVDGPTPYVRCPEVAPPAEGRTRVGKVTLVVEGRSLLVEGLPKTVRIAAFSGPGPVDVSLKAPLAALRKSFAPDLVFVLGGVSGLETRDTEARLESLARLGVPVLLVAGGRDRAEDWDQAFEGRADASPGVLDARGLRRIQIGADSFVPLSGAPFGRYAVGPDACGFGQEDLDQFEEGLRAAGARGWALSWAAPAGLGPGLGGVDPGRSDLREAIGERGGLFAWPRGPSPDPEAGAPPRFVVRPIAGALSVAADGTRLRPAPTRLELDERGLRRGP